jgi:hypothetical protein
MSAEFQYDVFLSHNLADKPLVRRLVERLRAEQPELQPSAFCPSAEIRPTPVVASSRSCGPTASKAFPLSINWELAKHPFAVLTEFHE